MHTLSITSILKMIDPGFAIAFIGSTATGVGSGYFITPVIQPITLGIVTAKHTSDNQWQFLFNLSNKVFEFLKKKQQYNADKYEDIIEWLKHKFKKSTYFSSQLNRFKNLCTKQIAQEDTMIPQSYINGPIESRLCFMGHSYYHGDQKENTTAQEKQQLQYATFKGNLKHLANDELKNLGFKDWVKSNHDLWKDFESSKKTFDEWYKEAYAKGKGDEKETNKKKKIIDILESN